MKNGKSICKQLKAVRQRIADANEIRYRPRECHYEGECSGTCPACEAEMRFIEDQLAFRRKKRLAVSVAGVAIGIGALSPVLVQAQTTLSQNTLKQTTKHGNEPTADWSNGAKDAVKVQGTVILQEDNEPVIGCCIYLIDSLGKINPNYGICTDLDGRYDVKVSSNAVLRFSFIGTKAKEIPVKELLKNNGIVILEEDKTTLQGEVIVGKIPSDGVYMPYVPKSKSTKSMKKGKSKSKKKQMP